jgi:hypothetical protein
MSPLFHHSDEDQPAPADAGPDVGSEVQRLGALPLNDLAAEVMMKGFGPGGPGEDPDNQVSVAGANIASGTEVSDIARIYDPKNRAAEPDALQLRRLIAEGVQVLEHAGLVRTQMHTAQNGLDYALTRKGRAAIASGTVEAALGGSA